MENNAIVKTLLCVMIKSVAGNYKDVVSITCLVNINADILHKVWLNVVKVVTELKFDITVTMTDGHSSNVKFFKEKLCGGFMKMWVPNPLSPGNRIFLLLDPTHLFKNIFFYLRIFFPRKINLSKLGKKFSQSHDSPRKLQHSTKIK